MMTHTRPAWYKPDVGLGFRMVLTMFLLGAVYLIFGIFMFRIGYGLFFIPIAVILACVQLFFADKIALASMGAREVSEAQANLPKPKIAIVNSSVPNAFATGRDKNHAVVAVTSGILNQLSEPELEAVLAHELTHVINRDMLVMTIAMFFSMVLSLMLNNLMWMGMFGGMGGGYGRRRNDEGEAILLIMVATGIAYFISFLLVRMLSRYRELAADRGSALITGAPQNLASALQRISGAMTRIPQQDFRRAQAVNALFIVPALRGDSLASLFSTHPSTEERIERLMAMQRQMESQGHSH